MSWDKQTINLSNLNGYIELLQNLEIPYSVEELGKVQGMGLNDIDDYTLRKLIVKDLVFVEQMQRTTDCDSMDYITLLTFRKDQMSDNIPLEITYDDKGNII